MKVGIRRAGTGDKRYLMRYRRYRQFISLSHFLSHMRWKTSFRHFFSNGGKKPWQNLPRLKQTPAFEKTWLDLFSIEVFNQIRVVFDRPRPPTLWDFGHFFGFWTSIYGLKSIFSWNEVNTYRDSCCSGIKWATNEEKSSRNIKVMAVLKTKIWPGQTFLSEFWEGHNFFIFDRKYLISGPFDPSGGIFEALWWSRAYYSIIFKKLEIKILFVRILVFWKKNRNF